MTCDEVRDLLPADSLGALEPGERAELEVHLDGCPSCAAERCDYDEVTARLALAVPQYEPPVALRERVLSLAERESSRLRMVERPRRFRLPALARPQPALLVAALALVVALGAALWAAGLQVQLNEQRAVAASLRDRAGRYDRVVAVLQSPDVELRPMQGTQLAPEALGRVYVDNQTGDGMFMVRALPPLPQGRVYQFWWGRADGARESGGLLTWTDQQGNGYAFVRCPGRLESWQTFWMTEEPAGGSPAPTGRGVIRGTN